jgi:hypothetical protein
MVSKSLRAAALILCGFGLCSSSAKATEALWSVTGPDTRYAGTFDYNTTPFYSNAVGFVGAEYFYLSNGTGAYAGETYFKLASDVGGTGELTFEDKYINYLIHFPDQVENPSGVSSEVVGAIDFVSISPVDAAPEPDVWALIISGVAMIGATLRAARKDDAFGVA